MEEVEMGAYIESAKGSPILDITRRTEVNWARTTEAGGDKSENDPVTETHTKQTAEGWER